MTALAAITESKPQWYSTPEPVKVAVLNKAPIVVAPGEGIGPELVEAVLTVLAAAGARLDVRRIDLGVMAYLRSVTPGFDSDAWQLLRERRVLLKGPLATLQAGAHSKVSGLLREALGLYADVRPCRTYAPFVRALRPGMDVVIIRDIQSDGDNSAMRPVTDQSHAYLRLVAPPAYESTLRCAFEFAHMNQRRKVSCFTDTDSDPALHNAFCRAFERIAARYAGIEAERLTIDADAEKLIKQPEQFDVAALPGLRGEALSRVLAELSGSAALCSSVTLGTRGAVFEAAPANGLGKPGRNSANPSGLLLAAIAMLRHLEQGDVAQRVHDAWLATIESGVHTADFDGNQFLRRRVGTQAFAAQVVARLGTQPQHLSATRLDLPYAHAGAGMCEGKPLRARNQRGLFVH